MALREEDRALDSWLAPLLIDFDALGDSGGPEILGEFEELRRDRGAMRISAQLPYSPPSSRSFYLGKGG